MRLKLTDSIHDIAKALDKKEGDELLKHYQEYYEWHWINRNLLLIVFPLISIENWANEKERENLCAQAQDILQQIENRLSQSPDEIANVYQLFSGQIKWTKRNPAIAATRIIQLNPELNRSKTR